jgi:hypothetical protein
MERGATLRAVLNRKLKMNNKEYAINSSRTGVVILNGIGEYSDGTTTVDTIKAGKPTKITVGTTFCANSRVVMVRVHPAFYAKGAVTNLMTVVPPEEDHTVSFIFKPTSDFSLQELNYIAELFIGE